MGKYTDVYLPTLGNFPIPKAMALGHFRKMHKNVSSWKYFPLQGARPWPNYKKLDAHVGNLE